MTTFSDVESAAAGPGFPLPSIPQMSTARVLAQSGFFRWFGESAPPGSERSATSFSGGRRGGFSLAGDLRRLDIHVPVPTPGRGLRARNRAGPPSARLGGRCLFMPESWEATPGAVPPHTPVIPGSSQRFTVLDGSIAISGAPGSGMTFFGTGRTFPADDADALRFAAIGTVLRGTGQLEGLTGDLVLGGHRTPGGEVSLELTVRLADPDGRLQAESEIEPLDPRDVSLDGRTFLCFHGEPDPDRQQTFNKGPRGEIVGSNVHELLRAIDLEFGIDARGRIRTQASIGPVVGRGFSKTLFNPLVAPGTIRDPIPYETRRSSYTFTSPEGVTVATLDADTIEGRAFATSIAGIPPSVPSFRFTGFGPFLAGTGPMQSVRGLLTVTSLGSLGAFVVSNFYTLMILDPEGAFREVIR